MNKKNQEKEFLKVIYFDESSAADLIYIKNQGEISKINEKNKNTKINTEISSNIGAGFSFFNIFKAKGDLNADLQHVDNRLVKQMITNTLLTDYLELSNEHNGINVFTSNKVYPDESSLTYIKLITPYLKMTEGSFELDKDFKLNPSEIDTVLENSRGYYEMILEDKIGKKVLRFNFKAFRNNYMLSDIVKMNLTYHAIKVGEINSKRLSFSNEFVEQESTSISGFEVGETINDDNVEDERFEVFDVILAGVTI